jgi:Flp pilus assembly pilin Flp
MAQAAVAQVIRIKVAVQDLLVREDGQDMVEYALLAALISIAAIAVILLIGPILNKVFQDVINAVP